MTSAQLFGPVGQQNQENDDIDPLLHPNSYKESDLVKSEKEISKSKMLVSNQDAADLPRAAGRYSPEELLARLESAPAALIVHQYDHVHAVEQRWSDVGKHVVAGYVA